MVWLEQLFGNTHKLTSEFRMSKQSPFTLASYPTAILHVDADAFFTSVEQAIHPSLKRQPIVTGKERNIISCASYEAKALGIKRGLPLFRAKRLCPKLVILPSDYETYSLYSKRMFSIIQRYTPLIEENSIDENFADISGFRRIFHAPYEQIALQMQNAIKEELDITVSIGLSLTKSLAKLASDFRKPGGLTAVQGRHIHILLQQIPLGKVWGFGPNTVQLLAKYGLKTAYDFAIKPENWVNHLLGKVGREILAELRGKVVYPVTPGEKASYATISKCRTFTPSSAIKEFVYATLVRNVESAFTKMRRHKLKAKTITIILREQDFNQTGIETDLSHPTASTQEMIPIIKTLFERLFKDNTEYRATIVVLGKLAEDRREQYELFEDRLRIERLSGVTKVVDKINEHFGKHTLSLAPTLFLKRTEQSSRDTQPMRKNTLLQGETRRRRLNLPLLFIKV